MFNGSVLKSRADGPGNPTFRQARDHMTATTLSKVLVSPHFSTSMAMFIAFLISNIREFDRFFPRLKNSGLIPKIIFEMASE